jgi:hypothetical protein
MKLNNVLTIFRILLKNHLKLMGYNYLHFFVNVVINYVLAKNKLTNCDVHNNVKLIFTTLSL